MPVAADCPSAVELQRFLLGQAAPAEADTLEAHLEQCSRCQHSLAELDVPDVLLRTARAVANRPSFESHLGGSLLERLAGLTATDGGLSTNQDLQALLAPPQGPGEIGRLGPYRILDVLGAGGMGVVFRAEDVQLGRRVALKVINPRLAASATARQRFLREARTAAAIEHDHIVPIYHVGEDRGVPFLAFPLLKGETLENRLEREKRLPIPEVLRIGREIARGLAAAHAAGLVHRDIKPANLWLEASTGRPSGGSRVKILDFGLARAVAEVQDLPAEPDAPADGSALTLAGAVLGTPAYMAPEQARGGTVDGRADLFSLGAVLYRMATGRKPFAGLEVTVVLASLQNDEPTPPRALNPAVPPALSGLILRLLAKDPEDRCQTAQEVEEKLAALDVARAGRRWLTLALVGMLVVLAGAALRPGGPLRRWFADAPEKSPGGPAVVRTCLFAPKTDYAVGPKPYCVAVGDFNGDGKPDLAVSCSDRVTPDLAVPGRDRVTVLLNCGDGSFRTGADLVGGVNPFVVVASDFDGDGRTDLAVANEKSASVSVFLGRGDGTFEAAHTFATAARPTGVAVGDFNGDGKPDLVVVTGSGQLNVLLGQGDGTFAPAVPQACLPAVSVAVGDFNGDGKADVAVSAGGADLVCVFLGNGDGTFAPHVPYSVGSGPGVVVVADFNSDGHADLAVENVSGHNVSLLLGNGDGTFRPAASYPAGQGPGGLAVGDFNGDGKPDLVVANHHSANVSVLLGNGDGTFRPALHYAAGWMPAGVAVGDFNGDGRPDVAVANYQGGDVSLLLNRPPAPSFRLNTRYSMAAGEGSTLTVTALDASGAPDPRYAGTLRVTSTDPRLQLEQAPVALRAADHGVGTLRFDLRTVGAQTVTVSDVADATRLGTFTILVMPGPAAGFRVEVPPKVTSGKVLRVTVSTVDAFDNRTTEYQGTVRVTTSDSAAILPPEYTFRNADAGGRWLATTLRTAGEQTITVTDTVNAKIAGNVTVTVVP
jgi:tRNA A-37 threonylcarbamoyl transferase component Bud32